MANQGTLLKVLLKQRHLQEHRAFCREYDRAARKIDPALVGGYPSKATFYRWLSGDLLKLPHPVHCRVIEGMFPERSASDLFRTVDGAVQSRADSPPSADSHPDPALSGPSDAVALYAHRSDTPKRLWLDLLSGAELNIDLFADASLFLPEANPETIKVLKEKAKQGVAIRIMLGDPDDPAMALRGREERLYDAIPARIRMALAYYSPLVGIDGVTFRLHGTSLYNSIFRYDDQMLVNQHIYGTYGYIAPVLHLRRDDDSDLFETYMRSFELVWGEESRVFTGVDLRALK